MTTPTAEPRSPLAAIENALASRAPIHEATKPADLPAEEFLSLLASPEAAVLLDRAADFLALRARYQSLLLRSVLLERLDHALTTAETNSEILRFAHLTARVLTQEPRRLDDFSPATPGRTARAPRPERPAPSRSPSAPPPQPPVAPPSPHPSASSAPSRAQPPAALRHPDISTSAPAPTPAPTRSQTPAPPAPAALSPSEPVARAQVGCHGWSKDAEGGRAQPVVQAHIPPEPPKGATDTRPESPALQPEPSPRTHAPFT